MVHLFVNMLWLIVLSSVVWKAVLGMGGAREMQLLLKNLFYDYEKTVRPTLDYSEPTTINAQLYVTFVLSLDTKHQLLTLKSFFRITWIDELLQWDPANYSGIDDIIVPQDMIWKPDMVVSNSAQEKGYIGDENVLVLINSNGTVKWEPGYYLEIPCKVDVSRYPFDVNVCSIHITPWQSDITTLRLEWPEEPISVSMMMDNGEFEVIPGRADRMRAGFSGKDYDTAILNLKMIRRPTYVVLSLLVPIILLELLSIMSFVMSPEEPEKVTVSITVLLSFTVFLSVIDNNIPHTSDNLSLLVAYVTSLLGLAFLGVVGNLSVIALSRWEKSVQTDKKHCTCLCGTSSFTSDYHPKNTRTDSTEKDGSRKNHNTSEELIELHRNPAFKISQSESRITDHADDARIGGDHMNKNGAQTLNRCMLIINCIVFILISVIVWQKIVYH